MNRQSFLKRLGIGLLAAPVVIKAITDKPLEQVAVNHPTPPVRDGIMPKTTGGLWPYVTGEKKLPAKFCKDDIVFWKKRKRRGGVKLYVVINIEGDTVEIRPVRTDDFTYKVHKDSLISFYSDYSTKTINLNG